MINIPFIFLQNALVGLYDSIQMDAEKIYWYDGKGGGHNKVASKQTSYGMFFFWYMEVAACLLFAGTSLIDFLWYIPAFAFLHYAGLEDFFYYFWEPIFKSDELTGREDPDKYYRFLWWRLPKELYWLGKEGHNSLWLRLFAGDRVEGKRFLVAVLIAVLIFLGVTL